MGLRLRLTLVVGLVVVTLVAAGSVALVLALSDGTRATLAHSLQRRARRVDAQLDSHLLPLALGPVRIAPSPDQSIVQILGPSRRLLYTTAAAGPVPLVPAAALASAHHRALWVQRLEPRWANPRLLLAEPASSAPGNVIVIGGSLDQVIDTVHRVDLIVEIAGPLIVAASVLGAWMLAGGVLRPVERLRTQVQAISTGARPARLARPGTRDELAALTDTFNDLLDRLHDALERQRQFVAAASHELRTPLAALEAEVEMATRSAAAGSDPSALTSRLGERVAHLVRLADALLVLAQSDEGATVVQVELQPLEPLVAASLAAYRAVAARSAVMLVLDADPLVVAPVDADRFRQVVENLLDNAVSHSPRGALVEVGVRRGVTSAVIEVRDHGPGFPADFLPHAFERFSRADPARTSHRGAGGLGLAIVRTIVDAHRGTVTAANAIGGGAIVTISIPLDLAPSRPGAPPRRRGPGSTSNHGTRP